MAAEMRAAGIIAGFCPKGAKDAKAAFGARDLLGPRGAGGSRNLRDHFRILGNFNGLQAEKFRIAQAGAARVSRAFTVAVQNISAPWAGDKMEAIKKKHGHRNGRNRKLSLYQAPVEGRRGCGEIMAASLHFSKLFQV